MPRDHSLFSVLSIPIYKMGTINNKKNNNIINNRNNTINPVGFPKDLGREPEGLSVNYNPSDSCDFLVLHWWLSLLFPKSWPVPLPTETMSLLFSSSVERSTEMQL